MIFIANGRFWIGPTAPSRPYLSTASLLSDRPMPPRERAVTSPILVAAAGMATDAQPEVGQADDVTSSPSGADEENPANAQEENAATAAPDTPQKQSTSTPPIEQPAIVSLVTETSPTTRAPAPAPSPAPEAEANRPSPAQDSATAETIRKALERADERRRIGDIFGMRLFLERATRLGSREAQLLLAQTYDERYLTKWGAIGVRPDPALAEALYEEAGVSRSAASNGSSSRAGRH